VLLLLTLLMDRDHKCRAESPPAQAHSHT
jgi:hypothetical protein